MYEAEDNSYFILSHIFIMKSLNKDYRLRINSAFSSFFPSFILLIVSTFFKYAWITEQTYGSEKFIVQA